MRAAVAFGLGRLIAAAAAAVLLHHGSVAADEAPPPPPDDAAKEKAAAKEILDLLMRQPTLSFDTTPVRFYINDTLFAVPRNMIAHKPEHVVEGPGASPGAANLSNRVTLHVMLPDMAGLTETNAECYVRGSDCELLVRVNIDTNHTGSALVPRQNEAKYYHHWGDTPTEIAADLTAFPPLKGYGMRYYLGRLTRDTSLPFRCNVPEYFAPLCRIKTGLDPGRGTINIFFNKSRWQDWREVYEGVQNLIASFRVEN